MSIFSEMNSNAICLVGPDHLLVLLIYNEHYQKNLKIFETFSHLLVGVQWGQILYFKIFKKVETISR